MREYELELKEALKNGLAPEKVPTNSQFLFDCLGFRCGRAGIEAHKELINPLPVTIDMYYSWPFPQFITGEKCNFLVVRDTTNQEDDVYLISADHSTVTYIFSVDELTFGLASLMEVADFGRYIVMVDGVAMIRGIPGAFVASKSIPTVPLMTTICNLKGQAIGGGVKSTWYDCDETFYIWSNIGYFDFVPDEGNEAGYRRDPYGGIVYHTRRLGDLAVGYSSKGIVFMIPSSDPTATIGFREVCNIGLINQGAMNGDMKRQIFVGSDYIVREVTSEGVKDLGYQKHIKSLAGEDIIVSYDPSLRDFYIGNSTKTFLLSPYGMTIVRQHPSAVWNSNNESYMIPETVDDESHFICTEPFDMGYRGQKTVCSIETDAHVVTAPEAGIDYDTPFSWVSGIYKPINREGIGAITVSGNEFRFRLRFGSVDDDVKIGYIKVRYKMTDLRGIRGVYAPPLRGQS